MTLEPEKGQQLFQIRANQAPSKEIVTYCASCVDTFRQNNFEAYHILELLWEMKTTGSWRNRYSLVKNIKREDKQC
ncbi:MAG TPA: hypothetical protein DCM59_13400 [Clostridium sp.]|nr:hypothetical protein [Clostridium sp.]